MYLNTNEKSGVILVADKEGTCAGLIASLITLISFFWIVEFWNDLKRLTIFCECNFRSSSLRVAIAPRHRIRIYQSLMVRRACCLCTIRTVERQAMRLSWSPVKRRQAVRCWSTRQRWDHDILSCLGAPRPRFSRCSSGVRTRRIIRGIASKRANRLFRCQYYRRIW